MSGTVVIIDESRLTRKIVDVCLHRERVACIGFPSGEAALRALDAQALFVPAMIFLEMDLPDISGLTLVRLLCSSPRFDRTIIVVFSGRSGMLDRLRAKRAGADHYLLKPFADHVFLSLVARYIPLAQDTQEVDTPTQRGGWNESHGFSSPGSGVGRCAGTEDYSRRRR